MYNRTIIIVQLFFHHLNNILKLTFLPNGITQIYRATFVQDLRQISYNISRQVKLLDQSQKFKLTNNEAIINQDLHFALGNQKIPYEIEIPIIKSNGESFYIKIKVTGVAENFFKFN